MERRTVIDAAQLIDVVGAGNPDPHDSGPVVVEVTLWDGRIVQATYYKGKLQPHIDFPTTVITDDSILTGPVNMLLNEGRGFIARGGKSDDTYELLWSIKGASAN